ncbi:hypothetical protein LCGC14_0207900 [marine sediment metagenome]|uniref:Uncharacterized protein n=1 Tax=marine sediment metagenome TaxID=412755 RepID=A0A0F9UKZ5_9ZZZZ
MFNQTDERIKKMALKGMTDEQIARKIGRPDEAGLRRVRKVTQPDSLQKEILHSVETRKDEDDEKR